MSVGEAKTMALSEVSTELENFFFFFFIFQCKISALSRDPPSGRDFLAGEGEEHVQRKELRFEKARFGADCPRNAREPGFCRATVTPAPEEVGHSIEIYRFFPFVLR